MIIYGRNAIQEALSGNWGLKEIRVAAGSEKGLNDIIRLAGEKKIPVKVVQRRDLDRWADSDSHQGVAGVAPEPKEKSLDEILAITGTSGPIVLLDGIEDPRNFGAILRTALAAGAIGVVTTRDRAAPLSPVAVKTSAGAAFTIPIARVTNLARTIDELKERNYWVFGADVDAEQTVHNVKWAEKSAIVLGGEGEGLRSLIKKKCDVLFKIPVNPKVESLNVSVAAGIILFEYKRCRILG